MKNGYHISIALAILSIMLGLTSICFGIIARTATDPEPYEVVGKYEKDGKCYVEVWLEVDPYEYIGLDVGDEYHIKK